MKMKKRMKMTPVNGRGFRDAQKTKVPGSSSRQKNVKVKAKRRRRSKPDEEELKDKEDIRADEPTQDAVEDTLVFS